MRAAVLYEYDQGKDDQGIVDAVGELIGFDHSS